MGRRKLGEVEQRMPFRYWRLDNYRGVDLLKADASAHRYARHSQVPPFPAAGSPSQTATSTSQSSTMSFPAARYASDSSDRRPSSSTTALAQSHDVIIVRPGTVLGKVVGILCPLEREDELQIAPHLQADSGADSVGTFGGCRQHAQPRRAAKTISRAIGHCAHL